MKEEERVLPGGTGLGLSRVVEAGALSGILGSLGSEQVWGVRTRTIRSQMGREMPLAALGDSELTLSRGWTMVQILV